MNKLTKILSVIFAGALCFSMAGCNSSEEKKFEGKTVISVNIWKAGLGIDYFERIQNAFETKYPEYALDVDSSSTDYFGSTIELGEKYNDYDLYVTGSPAKTVWKYLEPLADIFGATVEGENVTIKDKLNPNVYDAVKRMDDSMYYAPFGFTTIGLVYNADIINGSAYEVPLTTDMLIELTSNLSNNSITPFIHFKTDGYWMYFLPVWQAQYDGWDYYHNTFFMLDDETEMEPKKEVLTTQDGRYQVLQLLENLISPKTVYAGSNSQDFTDAQTKFLYNKAAMMVTGTWIENEMGSMAQSKNIKMMKTPVISSIIDRLETVSDDEELQAVIMAVDQANSAEEVALSGDGYDVSKEDAAEVFTARNLVMNNSDDNVLCIPNYAKEKEGAKKFVKFFYSDEAIQLYEAAMKAPMGVSYSDGRESDTSTWSQWGKDALESGKNAISLFTYSQKKHIMFTSGGISVFGATSPVVQFATNGNTQTAYSLWDSYVKDIEYNWTNYLKNAGLQ